MNDMQKKLHYNKKSYLTNGTAASELSKLSKT